MFATLRSFINNRITLTIILVFMLNSVMPVQATTANALVDSPGSLDTTFDGDGLVTTNASAYGIYDSEGRAVVVQSDDKVMVAGYTLRSFNGSLNRDFAVVLSQNPL